MTTPEHPGGPASPDETTDAKPHQAGDPQVWTPPPPPTPPDVAWVAGAPEAPAPRRKSSKTPAIIGAVAGVALLLGIGAFLLTAGSDDDGSSGGTPTSAVAPTSHPPQSPAHPDASGAPDATATELPGIPGFPTTSPKHRPTHSRYPTSAPTSPWDSGVAPTTNPWIR